MITFKQFVYEGSLSDLPIVLALRKELGITRKDAEETLAWLSDEDTDLPDTAYISLGFIFYSKLKNTGATSSDDAEKFFKEWLTSYIKKKYNLDIEKKDDHI